MLNANEKARLEAVAESLEWRVWWGDSDVELEKYSPEGEDFSFSVDCDTWEDLISSVAAYSADFDVDEHVELWIDGRGKRGIPSSVRALVEDAEAIDRMVRELASRLNYPDLNEEPEKSGSDPAVDPDRLDCAKQCLIDNGIEPDEAETVLQAIGYILMDTELYPAER